MLTRTVSGVLQERCTICPQSQTGFYTSLVPLLSAGCILNSVSVVAAANVL